MDTDKRHPLELAVYALVSVGLLVGLAAAIVDVHWFEQVYAMEDGPIEWATAIALLAGAGIAAVTARRPGAGNPSLHRLTWIGLALLCFFAAGEEISWGQRLLGIQSPEFFQSHNAQHETNLHNLVVGSVKVNKLIFSQLFTVAAALFLLALPWAYRRRPAFARLVDRWAVPVPRVRQVVAVVATFAFIALVPSRERDELLEFGATWLFAMILLFPLNGAAIRGPAARPGEPAAPGGEPGARASADRR
ncbi:hypothetical protein [Anaeromyxobacter dehalogenans]|uniref:Uncharacterized protein n=1 Tax=Anaeromyxobacter dehalogenans (strain 2CP-C) TaxID=290397 RepID=Q2IEW4_ANADE|nr:hypothetical protein [Anaeromyxobacter dehalogenans]ABC83126.1 hypothetical protein Adeh_3359 [Anaeromyxobacter dehalogenans 2CP-C]